jgi:hypothetical protein
MKTIKLFLCFIAALLISGCEDYQIDKEQYDRIIYLTRSIDLVKNEYINYSYAWDTIYVSVSISGSQYPNKDIRVTLQEEYGAIARYNNENLSVSDIQFRHLPVDAYEYPQTDVVIKAGQSTGVYPIYIYPDKLHCDSLYMLPFGIADVSAYEKRTKMDTILLARINVVNEYSGNYYMNGTKKDLGNNSEAPYLMYRTLTATNANMLRMFHESNENKDYLQSTTMTLTVNEADNTVTMASWNEFDLKDGGGKYVPELKIFDIWYEYSQGDANYRVEGFLYKVPKTELEQEDIDDWIRKETDRRRQ